MRIRMIALFAVAIHLKWMTLFGGIIPIITWILVACFFTTVFGFDFIITIIYHLKIQIGNLKIVKNKKEVRNS